MPTKVHYEQHCIFVLDDRSTSASVLQLWCSTDPACAAQHAGQVFVNVSCPQFPCVSQSQLHNVATHAFHVLQSQSAPHSRSDYCRDRAIAATLDLNAAPDCSDLAYGRYWTSVGEAMLTLFMSISGGIDWDDALVPLQTVSPIAVTAMLLYIVITVTWTMKWPVFFQCF